MDRSSILAHRGLFEHDQEKNSPIALERALGEGFGIETDLRDLNGSIVISHDPSMENQSPPTFEWLLRTIISSRSNGRIALNIKSDGLSSLIQAQLQSMNINQDRIYVFDMSVPDSLSYLKNDIPLYSRVSEYEPSPAFSSEATGIWVDNFNGSFPQVSFARKFLLQGKRVAIVSSELHKREHRSLWMEILESRLCFNPLFEICTDLPFEAAKLFCPP